MEGHQSWSQFISMSLYQCMSLVCLAFYRGVPAPGVPVFPTPLPIHVLIRANSANLVLTKLFLMSSPVSQHSMLHAE